MFCLCCLHCKAHPRIRVSVRNMYEIFSFFFLFHARRIKIQGILNLVRSTHGYNICSHFHLCIKNTDRNFKCRVSVFVHRLAPDDGCRSFFVLDLYFSWRFYRCSSCSACRVTSVSAGSVLQLQLFRFFPSDFLSSRGFYRILYADFMVVPFAFFSMDRHVKFLTNGRYRDIKAVNLLCIPSLYFTVSVVGSMISAPSFWASSVPMQTG